MDVISLVDELRTLRDGWCCGSCGIILQACVHCIFNIVVSLYLYYIFCARLWFVVHTLLLKRAQPYYLFSSLSLLCLFSIYTIPILCLLLLLLSPCLSIPLSSSSLISILCVRALLFVTFSLRVPCLRRHTRVPLLHTHHTRRTHWQRCAAFTCTLQEDRRHFGSSPSYLCCTWTRCVRYVYTAYHRTRTPPLYSGLFSLVGTLQTWFYKTFLTLPRFSWHCGLLVSSHISAAGWTDRTWRTWQRRRVR